MKFITYFITLFLVSSVVFAKSKWQGPAPDRAVENLFKYAQKGQLLMLQISLSGEALKQYGNPEGLEALNGVQKKFGKIHSYSSFTSQSERNGKSTLQHYEAQLFVKSAHGTTTVFGSALVDCIYFYEYTKNTQCYVQSLSF